MDIVRDADIEDCHSLHARTPSQYSKPQQLLGLLDGQDSDGAATRVMGGKTVLKACHMVVRTVSSVQCYTDARQRDELRFHPRRSGPLFYSPLPSIAFSEAAARDTSQSTDMRIYVNVYLAMAGGTTFTAGMKRTDKCGSRVLVSALSFFLCYLLIDVVLGGSFLPISVFMCTLVR